MKLGGVQQRDSLCGSHCSDRRFRLQNSYKRPRPYPAVSSVQHQGTSAAVTCQTYFKKGLVMPSQLLGSAGEDGQQTVYTVRFSTGFTRGSGLDEPYAGVQLCLIGGDGRAILHRVSPIFDSQALDEELKAIKRVVDNFVGANRRAIEQANCRIDSLPEGKKRFQIGGIDEISFLGQELGPLQSILVAPEEGSWRLEEVTVSSSRSRHTDRFVSGDLIGVKGAAGYLSAVPPDAVVYGSGEATTLLTREQARALHEAGMGKYSLLKERLIQANLSLVGIGTSLAWAFAGEDFAANFAFGGAGGVLYQWLLQKGVDGLPLHTFPLCHKSQGFVPGEVISRIVSSGGFRVALVGFFVFCAIYGSRLQDPAEAVHHTNHVQQILIGAAGFLMYKLAVVGVLTVPPLFQWDQPQEN